MYKFISIDCSFVISLSNESDCGYATIDAFFCSSVDFHIFIISKFKAPELMDHPRIMNKCIFSGIGNFVK